MQASGSDIKIYLRIDNAFGVPSPNRKSGWVAVTAVQLGSGRGISRSHRGEEAEYSDLSVSEVVLRRDTDRDSLKLQALYFSRKAHSIVVIEIVDTKQRHVLRKITLRNVILSGFSSSVSEYDSDDDNRRRRGDSDDEEEQAKPEPPAPKEKRVVKRDSLSLNFTAMEMTSYSPDREPLAIPVGLDVHSALEDYVNDVKNERLWANADVINLILKKLSTVEIHRFGKCCKLFAKSAANTDLRTIAKHSVVYSLSKNKMLNDKRAELNFEGKTHVQMIERGAYYEDEDDEL